MAANLTTTYASQILDLLGLSKFKGGAMHPLPPPPIKISLGIDLYVNYGVHGVRDCSRPPMVYNIYAKYGRPASAAAGFDIQIYGRPRWAAAESDIHLVQTCSL